MRSRKRKGDGGAPTGKGFLGNEKQSGGSHWILWPVHAVLHCIAWWLQTLILALEGMIHALGYEPIGRGEEGNHNVPVTGVSSNLRLVRRAEELGRNGELRAALRLYIKVLDSEPENTTAMDGAAEVLADLGDTNGAKELLVQSIRLQPGGGHTKYVLLGHLERGKKAIHRFEQALQLLYEQLKEVKAGGKKKGAAAARLSAEKKISSVLAAMAKIYLTDCFWEPHALQTCNRVLDRALLHDPDSAEATQALADLRLSQNRRGEALLLVKRTVDVCDNLGKTEQPSQEFQTVTARLLVELSQYDMAIHILEQLACEAGDDDEDENVEVWHLIGVCHLMLGNITISRKALTRAKELLAERTGPRSLAAMEQINSLLTRTSMSEAEKAHLWHPRWWLGPHAFPLKRPDTPVELRVLTENNSHAPGAAFRHSIPPPPSAHFTGGRAEFHQQRGKGYPPLTVNGLAIGSRAEGNENRVSSLSDGRKDSAAGLGRRSWKGMMGRENGFGMRSKVSRSKDSLSIEEGNGRLR